MCGIIGLLGQEDVAPRLLNGLERLEYRGYDSAGIAVVNGCGTAVHKAVGKLDRLRAVLDGVMPKGRVGLGHTRWATHGGATEPNAHPHQVGRVTLVHNGIIENHAALRQGLRAQGVIFASETDTEVVAALFDQMLYHFETPDAAFAALLDRLVGAYALAVVVDGYPELMFVARQGSPLAIGHGRPCEDGTAEMAVGSDALALAPFASRVTYLEDGDWGVLRPKSLELFNRLGAVVTREIVPTPANTLTSDKGSWPHYMRKEIAEQPDTLARLMQSLVDPGEGRLTAFLSDVGFASTDRIVLLACGTAHYACHLASYWIEAKARLPVEVEIASEYRYRDRPLSGREIVIAVSQSGETADTLSALTALSGRVAARVAVVNVTTSSIAREAQAVLDIAAGPEIGVASTKAFTAQLLALMGIALKAGRDRGVLSDAALATAVGEIASIPCLVAETLQLAPQISEVAKSLATAPNVYFLGRDVNYPMALEAALKMKEISYIHAEAFAAGELKHGPIALIERGTPIIVFDGPDRLAEKIASNVSEIEARGSRVIRVGPGAGCELRTPMAGPLSSSFAQAIVAQLLAYDVAVEKGTDVDQPRNLAKSVTVE
ncbi:glutamine--fructose-6-phosphate transaminase (isomerizing) [Mameliella alba]|uniref:glutamine--fructose-6-phosphate transaminase (isomerizing) n=1 Tax=Mameliella alba TaxID=561184 RepID=UPI000B52B49C|nr:glutamine--fructose-6-phosphate transaminase (isomerizing) [Mameliella alba]OWV39214.1 glutamine--fructose-6-phosphate transaminase (isomerizing) [Mameliella alba]